jgi:hypothetical protein
VPETSPDRGGAERPLPELAREITAGAVRLAAATAAWLRLVGEFDAREGWGGYGIRSCAHWLAWQCGLSPGTAREHVRVARALRDLPVIGAAFDAGRLSYAKVRALTRVAEPGTEAELLSFAVETTASQLERTVREWRRVDAADQAATDRDLRQARPDGPREQFDYWWNDDGSLVASIRLDPERGTAFLAAVNALAERTARRERAAARRAGAEERASGEGWAQDDEVARARGACQPGCVNA